MRNTFTLTAAVCAGLLLGAAPALRAQSLDPSFLPTVLKAPMTASLTMSVNTLAVQPDGKYLAAGGFDFVNGNLTGKLQRFNPDGTVDATFNIGTGANGFIAAVALQPDGKILVAGAISSFNGTAATPVLRLNPNGSLDATFAPATGAVPRQPTALALQPDGKMVVAGTFVDLFGQAYPGLVRLNANGTKDTSFNPGTGADGNVVWAVAVQPDGKILAAGNFTSFNGQAANSIVRLNADGSLDSGFSPSGVQPGSVPRVLLRQPTGNILVGGTVNVNGTLTYLLRLLPNGNLDNTFTPGTGPNGSVVSMVPQSSGAVLLGGNFTQYNGVARGRVARISADGVLDASFAPSAGANNTVQNVAATGTGQVLIGGGFGQYDGSAQPALARLSGSGSLDLGFAPLLEARGLVQQALTLTNSQLLVSGNFTSFNGTALTGAANLPRRLNADGSLDPTYAAAVSGTLQAVLPAGGAYVLEAATTLRRLLPGGALDNSFTMRPLAGRYGTSSNAVAPSLSGAVVQPDGKVLLYGLFSSCDGSLRNGLVRLLADGSLDASFVPPASSALPSVTNDFRRVTAAYVLPSGKILYRWTGYFNTAQTYLTRLNADGTLDNTFSIGTGPANAAGPVATFAVVPLAGDKLLLWGGDFTSVNGQYAPYGFTRLTATGAVDATFAGLNQFYLPRAVQPDGKIVATTSNTVLGNADDQLVRLNTDGSRDNSFAPVAVPASIFTNGDDGLIGITQQPADGNLVLFGSFRYVAGQPRIGLARLTNVTLSTRAGQRPQPLTLYPNPTHDRATVQLPAGAAQLRVLDLQGRLVQQRQLPARQTEAAINLTAVPAGLYLVQVVGSAGLYQQRVVVTP